MTRSTAMSRRARWSAYQFPLRPPTNPGRALIFPTWLTRALSGQREGRKHTLKANTSECSAATQAATGRRASLTQSCDPVSAGFRPNLDQANPRRFQPFAALDDIRNNSLPFAEAREARPFKSGDVHEHVLAAVISSD